MRRIEDLYNLIGNTPIIKIIYCYNGYVGNIYAKAEWYNLTGSIKDRPAFEIIKSAIDNGELKNKVLVEATSGNMGISLCAICSYLGIKSKIFMPSYMSEERKLLIKSYGGELCLVDDGFEKCVKLANSQSNAFVANQFENQFNVKAHYSTTANEIIKQTDISKIGAFVSGVGTGGTLIGVGKRLKEVNNDMKVVALEPWSSPILSGGIKKEKHVIQGISDEFIPKLYDSSIVDDIIQIKNEDALNLAQKLAQNGLGVGISSGANFLAGVLYGYKHKCDVVTIFADDNKKYFSTPYALELDKESLINVDILQIEVIK